MGRDGRGISSMISTMDKNVSLNEPALWVISFRERAAQTPREEKENRQ